MSYAESRFADLTRDLREEFERLEFANKQLQNRLESESQDQTNCDDDLPSIGSAVEHTPKFQLRCNDGHTVNHTLEFECQHPTKSFSLPEATGVMEKCPHGLTSDRTSDRTEPNRFRPKQLRRTVSLVQIQTHKWRDEPSIFSDHQNSEIMSNTNHDKIEFERSTSKCSLMLNVNEGRWRKLTMYLLESMSKCYQLNECWLDPCLDCVSDSDSSGSMMSQMMGRMDGVAKAYQNLTGLNASQKASIRMSRDMMQIPRIAWYTWKPFHPNSAFRYAWNVVGLFLYVYDFFRVTFGIYRPDIIVVFEILDWFRRCFWTGDMLISFNTAFFKHKTLHFNRKHIAARYIRSYFLYDCTATIADWFMLVFVFLRIIEPHTPHFYLMGLLRFIRFVKCQSLARRIMECINSIPHIIITNLAVYFLAMCVWVHLSGCIWFAIGQNDPVGWTHFAADDLHSPAMAYWLSVHWAVVQLQGSANVVIGKSIAERVYSVFDVLLCICFLAFFIGKLTNSMLQLQFSWSESAKHLRGIRLYIDRHQISPELSVQVRKYAEWKLSMESSGSIPDDKLLGIFPNNLRRQVVKETYSPRLCKQTIFFAISQHNGRFIERICCDLIKNSNVEPDDTIFTYGETCGCLYMSVSGDLQYVIYSSIIEALVMATTGWSGGMATRQTTSKGMSRATSYFSMGPATDFKKVREGQMLCEASLYTHWVHKGDLLSESHVCMIKLESNSFEKLVDAYPMVRRFGASHARRFVAVLNASKSVSDLFQTSDVFENASMLPDCDCVESSMDS